MHDFNPGILPNGLFWTMAIPSSGFSVARGGRQARLTVENIPIPDTFQFANNASIAAEISVDVHWNATSAKTRRGFGSDVPAEDPGAFLGDFCDASSHGYASGAETGFQFETNRMTADGFFAELGSQRNGVFLTETAPAEALMYGTSADRSGGSPLDGATVSGNIYVWLSPLRPEDVDAIAHVEFFVNGRLRHRENFAPYDMIGGGDAAATATWNTREASNGPTMVTAVVTRRDGATREVSAAFRVAN